MALAPSLQRGGLFDQDGKRPFPFYSVYVEISIRSGNNILFIVSF